MPITHRRINWEILGGLITGLVLLFMTLFKLENIPSIWWDEGWTLNVARNWVEYGHYGQILIGQPAPPGLSAAFPVVAPIALSFRILGIGIWQGRLPGVLFTLASFALIYLLAAKLYNRKIAWGGLAILVILVGGDEWITPIAVGRQALGEIPAIFFLLGGYVFFLLALEKSGTWVFAAILFWGIAIGSKAQILPFWLASLLIPLGAALIKGYKRQVGLFMLVLVGTVIINWFLQELITSMIIRPASTIGTVNGLIGVTAFVPSLLIRAYALLAALVYGLPVILGLAHNAFQWLKSWKAEGEQSSRLLFQLSLLSLSGAWLVWYVLLGMFWTRYLFPGLFIGSIFTAAWLYDLTQGYDLKRTFVNATAIFRKKTRTPETAMAFRAMLILIVYIPINMFYYIKFYSDTKGVSTQEAATYIDNNISSDATIETYESELMFLTDRRYHFPPDEVSVELTRRGNIDPQTPIHYDPDAESPGYLINGPYSKNWQLYDSFLSKGEFRLIASYPPYDIYQRIK